MRSTLLVLLAGMMLMAACAPATDAPSPTATPTTAPVEETQPPEPPEETEPPAPPEETEPPTTMDGQALLHDRCTECHSLSRVERAGKTAAGWESTVNRMIDYGAELSMEELEFLVQYLAETYPE